MVSSNAGFYSVEGKVYSSEGESGTSAGNVCSSEGDKVFSSEGGIDTTTGKVYTNQGGKSYSDECKACGSEGGMRGVREVQPLPSATGRVAVLRALFEDGVFRHQQTLRYQQRGHADARCQHTARYQQAARHQRMARYQQTAAWTCLLRSIVVSSIEVCWHASRGVSRP